MAAGAIPNFLTGWFVGLKGQTANRVPNVIAANTIEADTAAEVEPVLTEEQQLRREQYARMAARQGIMDAEEAARRLW